MALLNLGENNFSRSTVQQTKTVVAAMERRSRDVEAALVKAAEAKENAEACMKLATERGQ